jgi:hypothetical protein
MTDIVTLLRTNRGLIFDDYGAMGSPICLEAADEIERLQVLLSEARRERSERANDRQRLLLCEAEIERLRAENERMTREIERVSDTIPGAAAEIERMRS